LLLLKRFCLRGTVAHLARNISAQDCETLPRKVTSAPWLTALQETPRDISSVVPASEMTYIVSSGALNATHSPLILPPPQILRSDARAFCLFRGSIFNDPTRPTTAGIYIHYTRLAFFAELPFQTRDPNPIHSKQKIRTHYQADSTQFNITQPAG